MQSYKKKKKLSTQQMICIASILKNHINISKCSSLFSFIYLLFFTFNFLTIFLMIIFCLTIVFLVIGDDQSPFLSYLFSIKLFYSLKRKEKKRQVTLNISRHYTKAQYFPPSEGSYRINPAAVQQFLKLYKQKNILFLF